MARITVEDCLHKVGNRFGLVHAASRRVRQLMKGSRPLVDNTFSQNRIPVVALREIAAGHVYLKDQPGVVSADDVDEPDVA